MFAIKGYLSLSSLQDKADAERKAALLQYFEGTRQQFVRLLVLFRWSLVAPPNISKTKVPFCLFVYALRIYNRKFCCFWPNKIAVLQEPLMRCFSCIETSYLWQGNTKFLILFVSKAEHQYQICQQPSTCSQQVLTEDCPHV